MNQPPEQATPPTDQLDQKRLADNKKRQYLIASIAIGLLTLIGALVFIALSGNKTDKTSETTSNQTPSKPVVDKKPVDSAQAIIDKLFNKLTAADYQAPAKIVIEKQKDAVSPTYKPADESYYIATDKGIRLAVTAESDITQVGTDISKYLTDNDFKVHLKTDRNTIYQTETVVCRVVHAGNEVACADKLSYKAALETIRPFAIAYALANKDQPGTEASAFYNPVIKNSPTKGYQTAEVALHNVSGVGGSTAIFYKKSNDAWVYFHSAQNLLSCAQYSSDDTKNAFAGTTCFDDITEQESTVSVPAMKQE